jgi:hypothetical protein
MLSSNDVRVNSLGDMRPTQYLSKHKSKDGDFELRRIIQNVANRSISIGIPIQFCRRLGLSGGQVCSVQLIDDEDKSRLVISPLRIPGTSE